MSQRMNRISVMKNVCSFNVHYNDNIFMCVGKENGKRIRFKS